MTLATDLKYELRQFTGTENWYRSTLNRRVVYTDGVKFFAEKAGAYWFLDILATDVYQFHDQSYFLSVKLEVADDGTAVINVTDGNDKKLFRRYIEFTDAPMGEWSFYMIDNEEASVILLPSEY